MAVRVLAILFFSGGLATAPQLSVGGATNYSRGALAPAPLLSGGIATNYSPGGIASAPLSSGGIATNYSPDALASGPQLSGGIVTNYSRGGHAAAPLLSGAGATSYSRGGLASAPLLSGGGPTNYSPPLFLGLDGLPSENVSNESALRRGEVIFLLSYPFTFMASMLGYYTAATLVRTIDTGKSDIALSGGFFGLVAVSAAFLSFAIAMDDHSFIESKTQQSENGVTRYVSFGARW